MCYVKRLWVLWRWIRWDIHYKQAFDDIFKENGGLSEDEFLSEESFINDEYPEDDEIYN